MDLVVVLLALAGTPPSLLEPGLPRAPGAIGWASVDVPLAHPLQGPAWALVLGADAEGSARVLPFAEVLALHPRRAQVRYPVLLAADARAAATARASIVVTALGDERPVGRIPVAHRLEPGRPPVDADVDELVRLHGAWSEVAQRERAALVGLGDGDLRVGGPSPSRVRPEDGAALLGLGRARLEARAVLERLRGVALGAGPSTGPASRPLSALALEAVARLEFGVEAAPSAPGGRGLERADEEGIPVAVELGRVESALRAAQIAEAWRRLERARRSGRASARELARILVLTGLIARARGLGTAAAVALGQALCLEPGVEAPEPLPYWRGVLDGPRAGDPCAGRPLGFGEISVERTATGARRGLLVRGRVERDPFRLVERARVVRYGSGGAATGEATVDVEEGGGFGAPFLDPEGEPPFEGPRIGVAVDLLDRTGAIVARVGDRRPVDVEVRKGDGGVPVWVWILAGGAALAGAAVAAAVALSSDGGGERGVGPVRIDF